MADLRALEQWAEPLLRQLDANARRRLARQLGTDMRRSQRERIKAQRNPDGSRFQPRKPQARAQPGAIRRKAMFARIRTVTWFKTRSSASEATAGFFGNIARIARTHQYGLRDRVKRGGPIVKYPQRELLGISEQDRIRIRDTIIDHLAQGTRSK